jgi:hypothetical protein
MALLGLARYIPFWLSIFHRSPLMAVMSIVQTTMQLFALVFVFTSPGSEWFNAER